MTLKWNIFRIGGTKDYIRGLYEIGMAPIFKDDLG